MIKLWLILDQFKVPYFSVSLLVTIALVGLSILLMNCWGSRTPDTRVSCILFQ